MVALKVVKGNKTLRKSTQIPDKDKTWHTRTLRSRKLAQTKIKETAKIPDVHMKHIFQILTQEVANREVLKIEKFLLILRSRP